MKRNKAGSVEWDDDEAFLRGTRPPYEAIAPRIRLADLFCGCGGLSLGLAEAARRLALGTHVSLAVDVDPDAVSVYKANFPGANVIQGRVEDLFNVKGGASLSSVEKQVRRSAGDIDFLVGGPPCQGHSDLNNHTRRNDPRNAAYATMARAAKVLSPRVVIIENVPTVQHDVRKVVDVTVGELKELGYRVAQRVIDLQALGVPQRRRRHFVLATRVQGLNPTDVLTSLDSANERTTKRTVRWAIGDLARIKGKGLFDTGSTPSDANLQRINWLLQTGSYDLPNEMRPICHASDHSYNSMYGRLRWDEPAQTITTGFGSMGQGRYVHPTRPRTITPHEAARLQTIPDFWDFSSVSTRSGLAKLIGNSVPPVLATALAEPVLKRLFEGVQIRNGSHEISTQVMRPPPTLKDAASKSSKNGRVKSLSIGPAPSSREATKRFKAVRQTGTKAESSLRSELDRLSLTYSCDAGPVVGSRRRADFLFPEAGVAVLVDGCFWHSCPTHATYPKANRNWWRSKLRSNERRDHDTNRLLRKNGWIVLRFWAHESAPLCAEKVRAVLAYRTANGKSAPPHAGRYEDAEE